MDWGGRRILADMETLRGNQTAEKDHGEESRSNLQVLGPQKMGRIEIRPPFVSLKHAC